MNKLEKSNKKYKDKIFEDIKHIDEYGNEYWYARELQQVLEYSQWRRFDNVINRAKEACKSSNYVVSDHFANVGKKVKTGDSIRNIKDYKLSRYACYLIVQNGDSRKRLIALGQTYFAIQTRRQELTEQEYESLNENEKRAHNLVGKEVRKTIKRLGGTCQKIYQHQIKVWKNWKKTRKY